jgi:hypothetical protein
MLHAYKAQAIDCLYGYWINIKGKYTGLRQYRTTIFRSFITSGREDLNVCFFYIDNYDEQRLTTQQRHSALTILNTFHLLRHGSHKDNR